MLRTLSLQLGKIIYHKAYFIIKCWIAHVMSWTLRWEWKTDGCLGTVWPYQLFTLEITWLPGSWGCRRCPASQQSIAVYHTLYTASWEKIKIQRTGTSLVGQWLSHSPAEGAWSGNCIPYAAAKSFYAPAEGPHRPQQRSKILDAATETWQSQIKK